jgi:phage terminase large subunit GpA-like protein
MSIVCPCTKIYRADLADQILDRKLHPEWNGETTRMVLSFPKNEKLWDEYAEILRASSGEDWTSEADNAFYEQHRAEMDEGAEVYWPSRIKPGEVSAIQGAINFKIRDEGAFYAECQNEPVVQQNELQLLTPEEICLKVMGHGRGTVPADCVSLTAFTDIQQDHLFWMICGWTNDFTGYVIDYGGWPDQGIHYFTRRGIRMRLSNKYSGDEGAIMFAALTEIGNKICGKRYRTPDGREMSVDRWCIDGGYAARVPATEAYVSQSPYKKQIAITKGIGVKAKERPLSLSTYALKQRRGPWEWYWRTNPNNGGWITFNTNFWKTRVHNGLLLPLGSAGSIQLFKAPPSQHRMLAEHILAEKADRVEAKGNIAFEFIEIPNRDNEGLDCLVGCALGAQTVGIISSTERAVVKAKPRMSMAKMAARARGKSA